MITALIKQANIKPTTIVDRIKWQLEYLGYCTVNDPNSDPNDWLVLDVKTTGYGTVYVKIYNLCFGVERTHKVNRQYYSKNPINVGDCIKAVIQEKDKYKKTEVGEWIKTGEKENIIKCWKILDK